MVISFEKHRSKRQEQEAYRLELVDQIEAAHARRPDGERADQFYFAHIRQHFSIEMLESILERLQSRASNQ